jgi:hypothetical protein
MIRIFSSLLFILLFNTSFSQDTLLLLSGKKIVVSSVDLHDNTIAYKTIKKPVLKTIDPDRVFSVIYKDGTERIVYRTDSLDPLDFKVEEMRSFISGVQDAKHLYRNKFFMISGFVVGIGSVYALNFYGLIGPPLYSTVVGAFMPDMDKILTFKVGGDAAESFGISPGKYRNNITGSNSAPMIKKDQKLKINSSTIRFREDLNIDSAVAVINSGFKCSRVHAASENGKLKLFKSDKPQLLSSSPYREGFEKRVRDYKIRNAVISGLIGLVAGGIAFRYLLDDE